MELANESARNISHGFTLLRELNLQRGMGQFCDCILQLRIHPGKLFLAHKSVLAAFSPVLASLLPRHGALVELNFPYLTPETLDIILNYIYTGTLPPQSQEESVLSAAFHLQLEQLQQALKWRRKALAEITHTVQDKLNRKRRFVEGQSLDGTPLASPSYYPYGSDPLVSSSPSCEVVPVICHVRTAGTNKFPTQTCCQDRRAIFDIEHTGNVSDKNKHAKDVAHPGYLQTSHGLDNSSLLEQLFEPAEPKQDKLLAILTESSLNDLTGVVAKVGNQFSSPCKSRVFHSTLQEDTNETIPVQNPSTDNKDQCVHINHIICKDLSSETSSQNSNQSCAQFNRCDSNGDSRCVSDVDSIRSFNPYDSRKDEHLAEILSDTFNNKNSYSTNGNILADRSHICGRFASENCHDSHVPSCLEGSSSPDMNKTTCEKNHSGSKVWHEIRHQAKKSMFEGRPLEILTSEKVVGEDPQRSNEFSKARNEYVSDYHGELRYQCLLERRQSRVDSSDSDSDRAFPVSNVKAKDSSSVLETIDISEISLSTQPSSKSSGKRSTTHPFQCSMCERAFSQRGSLNRHMRSHLGVRPYSCPQCSMSFSRQYRVTEHMRVHQRSYVGPSEGHQRTATTGRDV
ncbi:hypermethylated in cancer 2 protein-like [Hoplias malabaricus]|uniref:hypermethylated in cancer 2 protein-like n=1 Tax=Hoplias malabaricus TaxID=27720 RepID=UPI003461CF27